MMPRKTHDRRAFNRRRGSNMLEYVIMTMAVAVLCTLAVLFLGGALRNTGARGTKKITGRELQREPTSGRANPAHANVLMD